MHANDRLRTGIPELDAHLGGGLFPGTLTVLAGATGIGKTQLGLDFLDAGQRQEGRRGIVFDMSSRGDSQNHRNYAAAHFDWQLHGMAIERPPAPEEAKTFRELLRPYYANRKVKNAGLTAAAMKTDNRVSWSNHLSAEATLIRMEEERRLRMGDEPTRRLTPEFRERFEDTLWAMVNSPEFVMVP